MFEHKREKLIPRDQYVGRQLRYALYAVAILLFSLLMGVAGYMATEGLPLIDALLNASMILTGMGPVNAMTNTSSKLFASFYSVYSGVAFVSVVGIMVAPAVHRFLHKMNMED